jgi:hypothetical protein
MKHIPVNKGVINLVKDPFDIFQNILILTVTWSEKDYTDTDRYEVKLSISAKQFSKIVEEKLIDKLVEFKINNNEEAEIIFPEKTYSEAEVKVLVINAWNQGYDDGWKHLRVPMCEAPIDFWRRNKK